MRKIYLAGPFRGYPGWNFPAFDAAQRRWEQEGWQVFSPAAVSRAMGYVPQQEEGVDWKHLRHVMLTDIACLYTADAIGLLPGWERSYGATVELAVAQYLNLPVYSAITGVELDVECLPWS